MSTQLGDSSEMLNYTRSEQGPVRSGDGYWDEALMPCSMTNSIIYHSVFFYNSHKCAIYYIKNYYDCWFVLI